jgi:hypothetical protein
MGSPAQDLSSLCSRLGMCCGSALLRQDCKSEGFGMIWAFLATSILATSILAGCLSAGISLSLWEIPLLHGCRLRRQKQLQRRLCLKLATRRVSSKAAIVREEWWWLNQSGCSAAGQFRSTAPLDAPVLQRVAPPQSVPPLSSPLTGRPTPFN